MANGDAAQAEGITLVPSSSPAAGGPGKVRMGYDQMNRILDIIVAWGLKPLTALSIARGGTGATTAAAARTALSVPSSADVAAALGGKSDTGHTHSGLVTGPVSFGWNGGLNRWHTPESISAAAATVGGDVNVGGHVYLPNSSIAVSPATIAYIDNATGRVCRGASSIRYKDLLDDPDVNTLGDIWPKWREFTMKGGDGTPILGYIADELATNPDQERFVVFAHAPDGEGGTGPTDLPDSIDFIQLLLAQAVQLHARVAKLEALLAAPEIRK